jgi:hypothetical protein
MGVEERAQAKHHTAARMSRESESEKGRERVGVQVEDEGERSRREGKYDNDMKHCR